MCLAALLFFEGDIFLWWKAEKVNFNRDPWEENSDVQRPGDHVRACGFFFQRVFGTMHCKVTNCSFVAIIYFFYEEPLATALSVHFPTKGEQTNEYISQQLLSATRRALFLLRFCGTIHILSSS